MSGGAPASAGPTTDLQPAQGAGDRRKDLKSSAPWEACMSMHIPVGTTALPLGFSQVRNKSPASQVLTS